MYRPLAAAALLLLVAAPAGAQESCNAGFAFAVPQIVRKEAIAAVDASYEVHFWSFCAGKEFNDLGNAGGLTRTIAANPLLAGPIEAKGWSVDDVKFVRVANGRIDLWLHRDP